MYLCVLCGSHNKQRLFPYTTLTVLIPETQCVYCAVRTETVYIIQSTPMIDILITPYGTKCSVRLPPYLRYSPVSPVLNALSE